MESLTANVARLKAYKERLIVFPRRNGQHKKGDASAEEVKGVHNKSTDTSRNVSGLITMVDKALAEAIREIDKSDMPEGEKEAYKKLQKARSDARLVGIREKKAKAEAEAAEAKK